MLVKTIKECLYFKH